MLRKLQSLISVITLMSLSFSLIIIGGENVRAKSPNLFSELISTENQSGEVKQTDYGKMPLLFEQNKGQTDKTAKFISRVGGYTVYLTEKEAVFSLKVEDKTAANDSDNPKKAKIKKTKSDILKMQFVGANSKPLIEGESEMITKTNYYIGKKRFENLSNYGKVNYKNLYDGIDTVFYGNQNNQLEYDFVVAPNTDANQIGLNFDGAENVSIAENGNLVIKTTNTELVQQKPFAYQTINGERKEIAVKYQIKDQKSYEVSFSIGEYDKSLPLVIDPALDYLTYIGGTAFDNAAEIAADAQGNAYITGTTSSLNFHGEVRSDNDGKGVYAAKINADGTSFVYVTILEGTGDDVGFGITLDASNNAYLAGVASNNFPTTSGAFDTVHGAVNNTDAFITKLNVNGNIVYSSFLGGSELDQAFDVAVDSSGKAYVTGETFSTQFFPTKNRYQGCGVFFPQSLNSIDAFLTVFNASGSDITYSTCIGGNVTGDSGFSVALDSLNNAYVTGIAKGGNFPTKNAAQSQSGGGTDSWVAKFNPASSGESSLIFSTYLGGGGTDSALSIAVDSSGSPHVTGVTGSTNFPLLNAFDTTNQINEAFVTKYNSNGTLAFSSFLGGADQDSGESIAIDNRGSVYISGETLSNDFPLALPFQNTRRGLRDAFITKIRIPTGVISSSYLGGNGNDGGRGIAVRGNHIYVSGFTESNNLLTTSGVIKATSNANAANDDGFVAKILDTRLDSVGVFSPTSTFQITQSTTNVVTQTLPLTTSLAGNNGVSGDFDGDGIDTIGSFTNGTWKIRNQNFPVVVLPPPLGVKTINFGQAGDLPVVGDWDNDGVDTPGVFRPSAGQFLLTNSTATSPTVDITVNFGANGDLPIAGDWDADGFDSVGVYRPSQATFFLTNDNVAAANIDVVAFLGIAEDLPVAGDFDGNGVDTIGLWRPSTREFFLTNDNVNIAANFVFGLSGGQPIVGDWDGRPIP